MRNKLVIAAAVPLLALTACSSSEKSSSPSSAAGSSSSSAAGSSASSPSSSSTPASAAASSASAAAPSSASAGMDAGLTSAQKDQVFAQVLKRVGGPSVRKDPAKAKANAQTICADLKSGKSFVGEIEVVAKMYPDLQRQAQGEFAGAAVGVYCPDQTSKLHA